MKEMNRCYELFARGSSRCHIADTCLPVISRLKDWAQHAMQTNKNNTPTSPPRMVTSTGHPISGSQPLSTVAENAEDLNELNSFGEEARDTLRAMPSMDSFESSFESSFREQSRKESFHPPGSHLPSQEQGPNPSIAAGAGSSTIGKHMVNSRSISWMHHWQSSSTQEITDPRSLQHSSGK